MWYYLFNIAALNSKGLVYMDDLAKQLAKKIIEKKGLHINEDTLIQGLYLMTFSFLLDAESNLLQLTQQQDHHVN